jgi:hypothetical protein
MERERVGSGWVGGEEEGDLHVQTPRHIDMHKNIMNYIFCRKELQINILWTLFHVLSHILLMFRV